MIHLLKKLCSLLLIVSFLLHGALGAGVAAVKGESVAAGAIGAVAAELVAEGLIELNGGASEISSSGQAWIKAASTLTGGFAAAAATSFKTGSLESGISSGTNAVDNNGLLLVQKYQAEREELERRTGDMVEKGEITPEQHEAFIEKGSLEEFDSFVYRRENMDPEIEGLSNTPLQRTAAKIGTKLANRYQDGQNTIEALASGQFSEANFTPAGFNNVVLNLGAQALGAIGDGVSAVNQWRRTNVGAFTISDSLGLALDGTERGVNFVQDRSTNLAQTGTYVALGDKALAKDAGLIAGFAATSALSPNKLGSVVKGAASVGKIASAGGKVGTAVKVESAASSVTAASSTSSAATGTAESVVRMSTVKHPLLPGEGRVGTYKELKSLEKPGDNLAAHHIPDKRYMKSHGVAFDDGIAIDVFDPARQAGGRHKQTHANLRNVNLDTNPRDGLAQAIKACKKAFVDDGVYTGEIRKSFLEVISKNKDAFPKMYKKEKP